MKIKVLIIAMYITGMLISSTNGEPVPGFDSKNLFTLSTHIATVEVLSDENLPSTLDINPAAPESNITVSVQRRIQGSDLPGVLTLTLTRGYRPFDGGAPLRAGSTLLAFLVRSPNNGGWQLSDPYYGLFRVSRTRTGTGLSANARGAVLSELRNSLDDFDATVVQAALKALTAFHDYGARSKALELSRSDNAHVAALALMFRFTVGDSEGLQDAVRLIEEDSGLTIGEKDLLVWSIAEPKTKITTQDLNHLLLNSTYPTLRKAVATILGERGDRSSVPALVAGLSDLDRETQYRCLIGLYRINDRVGPGYNDFMRDPEPTLNEWRQ